LVLQKGMALVVVGFRRVSFVSAVCAQFASAFRVIRSADVSRIVASGETAGVARQRRGTGHLSIGERWTARLTLTVGAVAGSPAHSLDRFFPLFRSRLASLRLMSMSSTNSIVLASQTILVI